MQKSRAILRIFPAKALPAPALHGRSTILGLLRKEQLENRRFLGTGINIFHKRNHNLLSSLETNCNLCHIRRLGTEDKQDVTFSFSNGLPVISVPLPSRKEMCKFVLRPVATTVGNFLSDLRQEDQGIDRAVIFATDGSRIAACTKIEHLMQNAFVLHINDQSYEVNPPKLEQTPVETSTDLDQAKILIAQLYGQLNIEEHQLIQQQQLLERLENLKTEILPLEQRKDRMAEKAKWRTSLLMWGGLAMMGTQFGILARLTWWEYSWDIMEPVTYFITYGTAIIMYGYFLLTQKEYVYPDARDRQYMRFFYRQAERTKFDVNKYNKLCGEIAQAEQDLKRLRDPLHLNLPAEPITIPHDPEGSKP
uniref:Calcium uniporter protein n=1 Tax=Phallusia mammillata TaxID=59560 RepID=A0A6F9DJT1_9ASCI|nr:calcium uniporter protein, mitochondrial [Phallusia mammillata]